jgi:putative dimethyl sulfoxide reductase chaperone
MKEKQLSIYEGLREKIYQWLAACYASPGVEMLEPLSDLEDALRNLSAEAADSIAALREEAISLDTLVVDYARLFVGPFKVLAPPYGSVYLENTRTVMGASTTDVRNRYQTFGLDTAKNFKDAPDHINAELEFMYYLIFQENEALKASDFESALGFLEAQKAFLTDHLSIWITEFTAAMEEHAQTDFYKHLAVASRIFVLGELKNINALSIAKLKRAASIEKA